jgi:GDP-mannose 6-dehydrogenase
MKISILGLGYVGCTSMACLAKLGHEIIGIDINTNKVKTVNSGRSPVFEPGINKLMEKYVVTGKIKAYDQAEDNVFPCDICLICVGTPSMSNGTIDTNALFSTVEQIAQIRKKHQKIIPIIVRSTAYPSVHQEAIEIIKNKLGESQPVAYAVHPEFLREGVAVKDFFKPPKVVFGCSDETAEKLCRKLYAGEEFANIFFTDLMTASLVKYADNSFHALKVTFANEMGAISKLIGVDSRKLMEIFCSDTKLNLSSYYLKPGFAFGGSCLPKDLRALTTLSKKNMVSIPMLDSVLVSNEHQIKEVIRKVMSYPSQKIGIFGLAFKENTDDLRESPILELAEFLIGKGKIISIYDTMISYEKMVGGNLNFAVEAVPHLSDLLVNDPETIILQSELVIIARDFKEVEWDKVPWKKEHVVIDLVGSSNLDNIPAKFEGLYW